MNKVKSFYCMLCAALLLLAGCAQPQKFESVEPLCIPNLEKADAIQAAEDILGKMHFTVAKSDTERGYIKTRPLPGAQFFEFWRSDNVGAFNWSEANLHSIRRTVELDISQQGQQLCIGCNVNVQRLNLPERQISNSSQMPGLFSEGDASMQKLILHPGAAWVDLGQDLELATEILKHLKEQITTLQKEKKL